MAGVGLQPAGTSPYGVGTPAVAPSSGGATLRDPATGRSLGGRRIDTKTGDYVLDQYGRLLGMQNVQQLVQLAVTTEQNSSAVRDMGHRLRSLDRITDNFKARLLDVLTTALKPLIDRNLVAVLGLSTFRAGPRDGLIAGRTYARLKWRDLTTGQEQEQLI